MAYACTGRGRGPRQSVQVRTRGEGVEKLKFSLLSVFILDLLLLGRFLGSG